MNHKLFKDKSGERHGKLIILSLAEVRILPPSPKNSKYFRKRNFWNVKCDCGTEKIMGSYIFYYPNFTNNTPNCGCLDKNSGTTSCNFNDLTGQRFGKLIVLEYAGVETYLKNGRGKHNTWKCKCDCGNIKVINASSLLQGVKFPDRGTHSCGCESRRIGKKNKKWKGGKLFSGSYWASVKSHSEKIGKEFLITQNDVEKLYEEQNRLCALTKLPIFFGDTELANKEGRKSKNGSIDRIDSSKGYTKDNIQLVCLEVNYMKNILSQNYFLEMCRLVAINN